MRILQITKKNPFPERDGETRAILDMAGHFKAGGHVIDLLAMNTTKHPGNIPQDQQIYEKIATVEVDNSIKPMDAFLNLFTRTAYNVSRFITVEFSVELKRLLESGEYDMIVLEGHFLLPYLNNIRRWSDARVVLRAHNVESEIWSDLARQTSGWKSWYYTISAKRIAKMELEYLDKVDGTLYITETDKDHFAKKSNTKPSAVLPFSISPSNTTKGFIKDVFFLGSLDWIPNQEGLEFFINEVWPQIRKIEPEIEFHIAGRNGGERYKTNSGKGIVVHGEIEDAGKYFETHGVFIIPLFSGSGLRIKAIEAMSFGKAVVGTATAFQGMNVKNGNEVLIADESTDFASAVLTLLNDEEQRSKITNNALNFIDENYSPRVLRKTLSEFLDLL